MIKESKFYLLASFLTVAVNFLTLPFFTQYLSPADYGVIGLFLVFGNVVTNLFAFGLNTATYGLFFRSTIEDFRILNFTIVLFLSFIFSAIGFFLIFPFAENIASVVFNNELNQNLIKLSFLNGCISYFYIFYGQLLVAQEKSMAFSLLAIVQVITNASITFYLILWHSLTFMAAVYGALIANFIVLIMVLIINRNLFFINFSITNLKAALKFGIPEVPNTLVSLLYGTFDKLMLVNYKGLSDVGHYDFGNKFAGILKIFIDAIGKSFSPYFLKNASSNTGAAKQEIVKTFYEIFVIYGFIGIGISLFSEEALIILTTEDFYVAKYLVPILVIYFIFGALNQISMNQFIHAQALYYLAPISLLGLFINLIANILLIPTYGAIGAAIATSFAAIATSLIQLYFANKAYPLPINYKNLITLLFIIIVSLISCYLVIFIEETYIIKFLLKILILTLYILLVAKFKFINIRSIKKHFNF